MAKFATNVSGAMLLPSLIQVTESISGSVVPLAKFLKSNHTTAPERSEEKIEDGVKSIWLEPNFMQVTSKWMTGVICSTTARIWGGSKTPDFMRSGAHGQHFLYIIFVQQLT